MLFMFHIMKVLVENSQYPAAFLLRKMFLRVQDHSREMNSRATPLKFVCPRISHYAFSQPVNCIFWPIETLNWLVVASKLHKHRGTCYTAEWPYCPFAILDPEIQLFSMSGLNLGLNHIAIRELKIVNSNLFTWYGIK